MAKKMMADYVIDWTNKTITLKVDFYNKAKKAGTKENKELVELLKTSCMGYEIVYHTINKGNRKPQPKVSYNFMENYIELKESEVNYPLVMAEYMERRTIGKAYDNAVTYNIIKKWFFEKYPEVKSFSSGTFDGFKNTGKIEFSDATAKTASEDFSLDKQNVA